MAIGGAIWGCRGLILLFFKGVLVFNFFYAVQVHPLFFLIIGDHPPFFWKVGWGRNFGHLLGVFLLQFWGRFRDRAGGPFFFEA